MANKKKPTMMEVKNAISNLIQEFANLASYISSLDKTLVAYIKYKKDDKKFPKWLEKQLKELKKESDKSNEKP